MPNSVGASPNGFSSSLSVRSKDFNAAFSWSDDAHHRLSNLLSGNLTTPEVAVVAARVPTAGEALQRAMIRRTISGENQKGIMSALRLEHRRDHDGSSTLGKYAVRSTSHMLAPHATPLSQHRGEDEELRGLERALREAARSRKEAIELSEVCSHLLASFGALHPILRPAITCESPYACGRT